MLYTPLYVYTRVLVKGAVLFSFPILEPSHCSSYFHFIASSFPIIWWLDFCVCVVIVVDGFHGHPFAGEIRRRPCRWPPLTSETFCLVLLPDDRKGKSYARLHVMPVFQPERATIFAGIIPPFFFIFLFFHEKEKKKKYVNITLTPIWKHCLRAKETVRRYETRSFKGSDFSLPNFFLFPVFFCKAHDFPVYSNQKVSGVYLFNCIPLRILCDCAHL